MYYLLFLVSFLVSFRQQVYLAYGVLFFLLGNILNGKCQLKGFKKQDVLFSERFIRIKIIYLR